MASRRGSVTLVAVALVVAACTNNLANPAPAPTAPPDAFASTPTIAGLPTTTLTPITVPDERLVLQRVDPVSLEPRTAFEPIPMGDWMWEPTTSADGRYLAATVNQDNAGSPELRLVDLQSWRPVASWPESGDLIVQVDGLGNVYYITYQAVPEFRIAWAGGSESTLVAPLPHHGVWGANPVTDRLFVIYGTKPAEPGSGRNEQVMVATIDLDNEGAVTEIPLPEVQIGSVDPVSQGPWASYLYTSPSFTWDPIGSRLLVVHGDEDVVSEVNIETGEVVEHPTAGTVDLQTGTRRQSILSPDARLLYVATRSVELIEDDDDWMVITRPAGMKAIDITTWETVVQTDQPISDIWVSPGGALLGSGYTTEESESVYVQESTGLSLLDADDLSVRAVYPPEREDQFWGPVTFSEAGSIAYVSTWVQTPQIHALELSSGEILSTAEGTETLEMIGPVGVLASNR